MCAEVVFIQFSICPLLYTCMNETPPACRVRARRMFVCVFQACEGVSYADGVVPDTLKAALTKGVQHIAETVSPCARMLSGVSDRTGCLDAVWMP